MTPDELLSCFHDLVRLRDAEVMPGQLLERDGLVRRRYFADRADADAMIESPEGLGPDPDAAIARQVAFFTALGRSVEWKTYSYDPPADLGDRLTRAGFVGGPDEAVMLGDLTVLAALDTTVADGTCLRPISDEADFERFGRLAELVWGPESRMVTERVRDRWLQTPEECAVFVVQDERSGDFVAKAWVDLGRDTVFAGLWGGTTHPLWRGRGLYRALLAARARWALERAGRYCRVDALPTSEPILTALGLRRVATTVPYTLTPTN